MRCATGESVIKASLTIILFIMAALNLGCSSAGEQSWGDRNITLAELRLYRAELSLYDGAPLVIPHEIDSLGRENCLNCHAPGRLDNGERIALPHPHSDWKPCRQCHLERVNSSEFAANNFIPLRWPIQDGRLSETGPKRIPHHIRNRENCALCHIGAQSHAALRADHGYRASCLQCHVTRVKNVY